MQQGRLAHWSILHWLFMYNYASLIDTLTVDSRVA